MRRDEWTKSRDGIDVVRDPSMRSQRCSRLEQHTYLGTHERSLVQLLQLPLVHGYDFFFLLDSLGIV